MYIIIFDLKTAVIDCDHILFCNVVIVQELQRFDFEFSVTYKKKKDHPEISWIIASWAMSNSFNIFH